VFARICGDFHVIQVGTCGLPAGDRADVVEINPVVGAIHYTKVSTKDYDMIVSV